MCICMCREEKSASQAFLLLPPRHEGINWPWTRGAIADPIPASSYGTDDTSIVLRVARSWVTRTGG